MVIVAADASAVDAPARFDANRRALVPRRSARVALPLMVVPDPGRLGVYSSALVLTTFLPR
jgi:hypothetical protein